MKKNITLRAFRINTSETTTLDDNLPLELKDALLKKTTITGRFKKLNSSDEEGDIDLINVYKILFSP